MGFVPTTSCIRGKRLTARPQGPHSIPDGIWRVPLWRKILSRCFNISLGVVRSLPWGPRGLAVRRLPRMQEVVGSNPTEGKIWLFLQFTLFYRVECEKLFCKTSVMKRTLRVRTSLSTAWPRMCEARGVHSCHPPAHPHHRTSTSSPLVLSSAGVRTNLRPIIGPNLGHYLWPAFNLYKRAFYAQQFSLSLTG